jgi:hypothetical protein
LEELESSPERAPGRLSLVAHVQVTLVGACPVVDALVVEGEQEAGGGQRFHVVKLERFVRVGSGQELVGSAPEPIGDCLPTL